MMRNELTGLLRNGEDSNIEFKRDDVQNHDLAKELVAFLNLEGGMILLGVEDDGTISGTTRARLEEWTSEICRTKIEPPIVPLLSWVRDAEPGRDVLAVRVTLGPNKPYARVHNARKTYYIRVGSTSREASREELERMFQASGRLNYGLKPVPGASLEVLDQRRLRDYFTRILRGDAPGEEDCTGWERLLTNVDLFTESADQYVATVDGMLLFGRQPQRFLPHSGIRAICYTGTDRDYATSADEDIRGAMVPLGTAAGSIAEPGLIEQALDFVRRNTDPMSHLEEGRRIDRWEYPDEVLREVIVNALVHRDYSVTGADILLEIFADHLEVTSPGRLPNTVTPEGMRDGLRYARNQTLVNVMRDYGYVEGRGMGVRNKIIPGMRAHNNTEPDLIAEDHRFIVRLLKGSTTDGG
ncbi:MAG: ATP-dependent DNA helicase RecG [Deltaproteobacteria bacterium]|nr:ATP-dependent DNA helicase RecG [Deltaproteobacteria bacterium]